MKKVLRKLPLILILAALVGGLVYAFRPQPVAVDLARIERGKLLVTVDEDGKTRIKQRYVVSAPLAGKLRRIVLKPGDPARSPLAIIEPAKPVLLDARSRVEAKARVSAAESRLEKAKEDLGRAVIAEKYASTEHERQKSLSAGTSKQELENAALRDETSQREKKAAKFAVDVAEFELKLARATLDYSNGLSPGEMEDWKFIIPSPDDGAKVLKVMQESEAVVAAGAPLVEIGNPDDLEAEIDVLTTAAVKIKPNGRVMLVHWGGRDREGRDITIDGHVWRIEPSGFTKLSALGVEEQRVNVIVRFTVPNEFSGAIGEHYRVEAQFVLWEGKDVLKVPNAALFRHEGKQAVYVHRGGRAVLQPVEVDQDHANGQDSEVRKGLEKGDEVILYPGDRVKEGVLIAPRAKD